MTVLFACGEEEGFISTGNVIWTTASSRHDSTVSNGAFDLIDTASIQADFTATTDIWVHFKGYLRSSTLVAGTYLEIRNGTTPLVRLHALATNPNGIDFDYWNGSAWITVLADAITELTLEDIDIHCNFAVAGEFTLFQDGNQKASFTGDATVGGFSNADNIIFVGHRSITDFTIISQVLVKTNNTIGDIVQTGAPTADGALTAWSGTFADIDDLGTNDDGTLVGSSVADAESSYVIADPSVLSGKSIEAVVHVVRASRDATGPQNLQLTTISGGTSYPSSSFPLELGLAPYQNIRAVDPDTSASWTNSGASNALMGVKAKT